MAGKKRFRAGVDGGPGAIGFASVEIDGEGRPFRFARVAVRRFPSGIETGDDLPVSIARRIKKSVRTQRKTVKARRRDVLDYLATNFRPDMSVDPYEARALCVGTEPVAPGVIGRALYHLSKHRGVDVKAQEQAIAALEAAEAAGSDDMVDAEGARAKSKRKPVKNSATLSDDETSLASQRKKELGPVKQGVERLEAALSGSRETLGVYLKNRLGRGETVRFRPVVSGVKTVYPLMPSRALVLHEIDTIIAAQRPFHPSLSEDFALRFKELAFPKRTFQVQPPLPCTICPDEPRLERGAATTELLRILGDVANLRLIDGERPRFLTWEEASRVVVLLSERGGTSVPYASIRAALGLSEHVFTREVKATMDGLRPDRVRQALRRAGETLPVCPPAVAGDPAAVLSVLAEEAKRLDAVVAGLCDRLPEADALVVGALLPKRRPRIGRRATDALIDRINDGRVDAGMMRWDAALP